MSASGAWRKFKLENHPIWRGLSIAIARPRAPEAGINRNATARGFVQAQAVPSPRTCAQPSRHWGQTRSSARQTSNRRACPRASRGGRRRLASLAAPVSSAAAGVARRFGRGSAVGDSCSVRRNAKMPRPQSRRFWNHASFLHEVCATLADRGEHRRHRSSRMPAGNGGRSYARPERSRRRRTVCTYERSHATPRKPKYRLLVDMPMEKSTASAWNVPQRTYSKRDVHPSCGFSRLNQPRPRSPGQSPFSCAHAASHARYP
jgi:hypothetical protein